MATPAYDAFSDAATPAGNARIPTGWPDRIRRLALDLRLVAHDHLELALLEAQSAQQAFVRIVAAAVFVSVLAATAWLGIVAALIVWLTEVVSWPVALLIGAAACIAIAGVIVWYVMKHLPDLMFSATLRQLKATARAEDEADHGSDEVKA
ncbi:MAG TPA: phage holin family protein [Casimicrobiaceae bacterium]|nr:phage holin family protein [Casimicrobiaceae bacterium]